MSALARARRLVSIVTLRLRSLFGKARVERDLDRELAFHVDQQIEEHIARGLSPADARDAALRNFGGVMQIQEACRDTRRTQHLETLWADLRFALRALRGTPGFTIIILLTMALAIGANSAIFSIIEGVLLRPLPYANPDRLVRLYFNSDTQPKFPLNPNDLLDFRARNRTFDGIAAITRSDVQLSGAGEPVMLRGFRISAGYFQLLGLHPARGREFTTDDELPERGRVAILSDRLWRTRFAADPGIIGRTITLSAVPFVVVGVMPPATRHPGNTFRAVADGETVDVWYPYTFDDNPNARGAHFMDGFGRLKAGVSPEQGTADLSAVLAQLQQEKRTGLGWRVFASPLQTELVGRQQRMLFVLLGAVGLLLLVACVNAANLLLARSSARIREIAVRSALGATRTRIVRLLLTESGVIATGGAALGTLLAAGGVRLLVALLPTGFPRASEIHLNATVFAFTLIVSIGTGVLFGLVPALSASRTDVQQALREGGRGTTAGGRVLRVRHVLIAGETALACVLLIAGGLLLHSFVNLLRADPGFRPQQVLTASVALPRASYRDDAAIVRFYERLVSELARLPGVESAGAGSDLPWTGYDGNADGFLVEGRPREYSRTTTARYHTASPGHFEAVGIPLLRGRFPVPEDTLGTPYVILVNETMAQRYWPGEDAIDKRISFSSQPAEKDWFRIIGIVRDVKDQPDGDSRAVRPAFWMPCSQDPARAMSLAVRTSSDEAAASLANAVRGAVQRIDPELALDDVRSMTQIADAALSGQRFALFLVALFAALALALAAIGMYGVMSYAVNRRMHEFGLRLALGARPWGLLRLIVGQGLRLAMVGVAIGLLFAAVLARLLGSLLYEVSGTDAITFAAVPLVALTTAMIACYVPGRRAMEADPMQSLRSE